MGQEVTFYSIFPNNFPKTCILNEATIKRRSFLLSTCFSLSIFRQLCPGSKAPPLVSIFSLLMVSPRLFFYYNQARNIFARSIFLKYRPGDISPPLKNALLMLTYYIIVSKASIIWTQVTFLMLSFYPATLKIINMWHIYHHVPPQAHVFIQRLVVESLLRAWNLFSSRNIISMWFLTS